MRQIIFAFILLIGFQSQADNIIKNSKVTEVVVYRSYAKETRIGSATIPEGNSEIVITYIPQSIDENSIQVGCKNNVKILSVSSRLNYLTDELALNTKQMNEWKDSINLLDKKAQLIAKYKEGYEVELNILNMNNKLGSTDESMKPAQLKELLELNRIKQAELHKLIFNANEEYNELRNTIAKLQKQQGEMTQSAKGKPVREIVLKVNSSNQVNTQFKISYLVTAASWSPTYEIRCENTSKPLMLNCRAKIVQQTGYDWKDIRIKLSTANPSQNHNRPILYPIYVDFMQPDYYKNVLQKSSYGKSTSEISYNAPGTVQMMESSNMAYLDKKDAFVDGLKIDEKSVTISQGEMMVEYDLENTQDIESDGKEHIVGIQELSLPANYNYHTVPKIDNGVFLLARVTDWGKYNLLAGDATLFFDDMYVGKSYINPNISADTLLISMGRDDKIAVKRIKVNDLCVTKKFSNKKKETKAFETTIKNNKNVAVEVEMLDQFPIAKNSDIDVTLDESDGAEVTKEFGKLLWRIKLNPGESKKVRLIYSLKFADDKKVIENN
jgi:uncharacterized protein (TIGR02231 family)